MAAAQEKAEEAGRVDEVRRRFYEHRRERIRTHGPETWDEAEVLYLCRACGKATVVRDAFYGREVEGPIDRFLDDLKARWFATRSALKATACPKCGAARTSPAVRAWFAHFLGEVGLDYGVELAPAATDGDAPEGDQPTTGEVVGCWRADARGRVFRLPPPGDERDFRGQTGTCFDLRAAWRQLVAEFRESGSRRETVLAEVQSGYLVGARAGVPGDAHPERRHDPHLEHLISQHDRRTYDTLEFLRHPAAESETEALPFVGERLDEWLGDEGAAVARGEIELFALADSSEFLACIEDLAAKRGVAVEWVDPDEDLKVAFHLDALRLEVQFAYPFLRALHTARSFVGAARAFYVPLLDALEDARDIVELAQDEIGADERFVVEVVDGVMLRIADDAGVEVSRTNLMTIAGRLAFRGREGNQALFELLGWDPAERAFKPRTARLDQCPLCSEAARIGKVIRPAALAGLDKARLMGVEVGSALVLYTPECADHSTPVEAAPGRSLSTLEAAWRSGLETARLRLVEHRPMGLDGAEAALLVGFDVGSLVLEPERLLAALRAIEFPDIEGLDAVHAYAFFPDALVVAPRKLSPRARNEARVAALEALLPRFPARLWPLDIGRSVSLEVDALGHIDLPA